MASLKRFRNLSKGLSLLEVALSIMIIAVLSVGVSSLIKMGVEGQMAERSHQHMQTIGLNIVDDLRHDIRTSEEVSISGGGNTLSLVMDKDTNETVIYELVSGEFRRRKPGQTTKIYNDPTMYANLMQVSCPSGCFEAGTVNNSNETKQVRIPELRVEHRLPANNSGTVIDQFFGVPNFSIKDSAFDVLSATEFQ